MLNLIDSDEWCMMMHDGLVAKMDCCSVFFPWEMLNKFEHIGVSSVLGARENREDEGRFLEVLL